MSNTLIGESIKRVDGHEKVTGTVGYTVNLELPGMVHAKILRSTMPHAKLVRIDASKAEALPGVVAVLTRDDLLAWDIDPYYGPVYLDQPIVAIDKVRFVGDPVAAVAAVSAEIAEEALELIEVEYEDLEPVFDPVEAAQPGAPLVHDKPPRQAAVFSDVKTAQQKESTNICNHFKLRHGDVEAGFAQADYIFEDVYTSQTTQHCHLEPHATIAQVHKDGRIEVISSTQNPSVIREALAQMYRLPMSKVRVVAPPLGAGYGAKTYPKLEPLTVALAKKAGRPVKLVLTREEVFLTLTRHANVFRLKTGVTKDGRIVARKSEIYWDTGSYADIGPRTIKNGGYASVGPYRIPNAQVDSYCVYTNKPPAGAFRGYGIPQVCWAYEQQMDDIAERLGIDRVEIRRINALREGDQFVTGETMHAIPVVEAVEAVADYLKLDEEIDKTAGDPTGVKRRGRGLACMMKSTMTPSLSSAIVKLEEDGSVTVLSSSVEMGQGASTLLRQIAAELLQVPVTRVKLVLADTDVTPYDQSTSSSRTTFSMGNAVKLACLEIEKQLLEIASDALEVAADDLVLEDGHVMVKGSPDRKKSYEDLMRHRFGSRIGTLIGRGEFKTDGGLDPETGQGKASAFWFSGAGGCEVEVDTETGQVTVLDYVAVVNAGKAINPLSCEGQIEGSVITGLGHTFYEHLIFDYGQAINPNFLDYQLPSTFELPKKMTSIMLESPHKEAPFGAIGVGETAISTVSPAIANAIYDAVGIRIHDLPITPEKVLKALAEKKNGEK